MFAARHAMFVVCSALAILGDAMASPRQSLPSNGFLGQPQLYPFLPPLWKPITIVNPQSITKTHFCAAAAMMSAAPDYHVPGEPPKLEPDKPKPVGENHGGKWIPGDLPGPSVTKGKPSVGIKAPGKTGIGGPGGKGPTAGGFPVGSGGAPRASGAGAPGAAKGAAGALSGKKRSTVSLDRWDLWWDLNKETFLVARSMGASELTKKRGFLDGAGITMDVAVSRQPPEAVLIEDVIPALRQSLEDSDATVRAAAALALGRVGRPEMSEVLIGDLRQALADPDTAVRSSAMLAIGAFGDRNATRALWAVMYDTREGREMLGSDSAILPRDRALAAFSLGLSDGGDVATQCRRLLARSSVLDFEIVGSAILSLGLAGQNDTDLVPFLGGMLTDERLDRRVRAQVPLALARIGSPAVTMIPYLTQYARSEREEGLLRESSVLALGHLASSFDTEVVALLRDLSHDDSNATVRHYATLGLAQIAGRTAGSAADDVLRGITRHLLQQIARPRYGIDAPWSALSAGIVAGSLPRDSEIRRDLVDSLTAEFRKANNPAEEGALAIALGLSRASDASGVLLDHYEKRNDDSTLSYIATALGLIGSRDSIPVLENALRNDSKPQLRVAAARALDLLGARDIADEVMTRLEGKIAVADARSVALAAAHLREPNIAIRLARVARKQGIDPIVRAACCEALGILGERTEIPFHSELTRDLNVHVGLSAPSEVIDRL